MSNLEKFWEALKILKSDVQATVHGDVTSEDDFNNNIFWVTGENDGTAITTKINPQTIDHSQLVPLLTAALQEAITKIETLETKVAALESA